MDKDEKTLDIVTSPVIEDAFRHDVVYEYVDGLEDATAKTEKPVVKDLKSITEDTSGDINLNVIKWEAKLKFHERNGINETSAEAQKRKLDEAEQSVSKHGSRKKVWNLVFFIINIAVVAGILVYQFSKEGSVDLDIKLQINFWAVLCLALVFIGIITVETLGLSYLLHASTGRWRVGLSFKVYILGSYYDNITPLATGGQPFQITYLKKHDIPIESALSVPLARYTFSQIVWVLVSFICMIISFTNKDYNSFVSIVSVIGFILGSFMLFVTIFLSVCKTVGRKLVVKSLKLLQKMKIVKNYERQYEKISKYIEDFQGIMQKYIKSPKDFIVLFGCHLVKLIFCNSLPYFVAAVFIGFEPGLYLKFFIMSILISLASGFFPLPGGTGMSEYTYTALFTSYLGPKGVVWALLVWRFMTYYVYLLQGIILLVYDFVYGNRKYRWQKTRASLMEESSIFKQAQINKFRAERNKRRARNV